MKRTRTIVSRRGPSFDPDSYRLAQSLRASRLIQKLASPIKTNIHPAGCSRRGNKVHTIYSDSKNNIMYRDACTMQLQIYIIFKQLWHKMSFKQRLKPTMTRLAVYIDIFAKIKSETGFLRFEHHSSAPFYPHGLSMHWGITRFVSSVINN